MGIIFKNEVKQFGTFTVAEEIETTKAFMEKCGLKPITVQELTFLDRMLVGIPSFAPAMFVVKTNATEREWNKYLRRLKATHQGAKLF